MCCSRRAELPKKLCCVAALLIYCKRPGERLGEWTHQSFSQNYGWFLFLLPLICSSDQRQQTVVVFVVFVVFVPVSCLFRALPPSRARKTRKSHETAMETHENHENYKLHIFLQKNPSTKIFTYSEAVKTVKIVKMVKTVTFTQAWCAWNVKTVKTVKNVKITQGGWAWKPFGRGKAIWPWKHQMAHSCFFREREQYVHEKGVRMVPQVHHVVNVKFNLSPLCHHCFTNFAMLTDLNLVYISLYTLLQPFYYVSSHALGPILSAASHGQRPHLSYQTITLSDQSTSFGYGFLHHSSAHPAGHLRLLHPIDRSFYNWTWNLCNNWQPETHITTSWPPRSQATSPRKHTTALRWSTLTTPEVILSQTWKPWWRIHSCRDGRYTYKRPTSTWWSIQIKALRCSMTFLILSWTSWTGFIHHGRLTNTSMPSRHANVHLCCWHPIQIHKIRALRSISKWFLEGIHSLRQHDIPRLRLDTLDMHIPIKGKRTACGNIEPFCWSSLLPISSCWFPVFSRVHETTSTFGCCSYLKLDLNWQISASVCLDLIFIVSIHGDPHDWWRPSDDPSTFFDDPNRWH